MVSGQDTISLLAQAQSGDERAIDRFLMLIRDEHMPPRIHRYIKKNVLVEQGEIESEFLKGCWKAMQSAKLDVGNPLLFILWKGQLAVAQLFRKQIKQGVKLTCVTCGDASMGYAKGKVQCGRCGSTNVTTQMVLVNESQLLDERAEGERGPIWDKITAGDMHVEMDMVFGVATYDLQVEEIRKRLNGRVLQLFDAIVVEGINRDSSQNYLAEIAKSWGISTTAVAIYLRKLREKIEAYYAGTDVVAAA